MRQAKNVKLMFFLVLSLFFITIIVTETKAEYWDYLTRGLADQLYCHTGSCGIAGGTNLTASGCDDPNNYAKFYNATHLICNTSSIGGGVSGAYLALDQSNPQTVTAGYPYFESGINLSANGNQILFSNQVLGRSALIDVKNIGGGGGVVDSWFNFYGYSNSNFINMLELYKGNGSFNNSVIADTFYTRDSQICDNFKCYTLADLNTTGGAGAESDPFWLANYTNMQTDCPNGNYSYGMYANGTFKCRSDVSGGGSSSDNLEWNITYQNVRDPTGFRNRNESNLSFNPNTRNLSINGSYTLYVDGVRKEKFNESIIITDTTGFHYVYYDDAFTLKQSLTAWGFESIAQVATVYFNGSHAIVGDERHGIDMDWKTHEYLHETVGTRYAIGLAGTFTSNGFNITAGEFYDEDNEFITGKEWTCDLLYRNTSNTLWLDDQEQYYYKNITNMYYDNGGILTAVPTNQYMAVWFFATNNVDSPIMCLLGQRVDATLANARTNNAYSSLSFADMPVPEFKALYRVIIRNDATPYEEAQDFRATSTLSSGTYVATDHGTLTGLTDDDHTQYLLTDGTRALTGNWDNSYNISAKSFISNDVYYKNSSGSNKWRTYVDSDGNLITEYVG